MNREQLEKEIFEKTVKKIAKDANLENKAVITGIQNILVKKGITTPEEICDYSNKCYKFLFEELKKSVKHNVEKTKTEELYILKKGFDEEAQIKKDHFNNL